MQACDLMFIINTFNWLALNITQRFNAQARVPERTRDVILSSNIIFNSLQGLHDEEVYILRACRVYWIL